VELRVSFFGVRGSTPCACDSQRRYGGNTSSVVVEPAAGGPILLDLGTGARFFGLTQPPDVPFVATVLCSHLHWDHIQGLPFFGPALTAGSELTVYAPAQDDGRSIAEVFADLIRPPQFPIALAMLPAEFRFREAAGRFELPGAQVLVGRVPHVGPTVGYRVEADGAAVAYVPDHQQPVDGSWDVADSVVELCAGADLLIHDAQYLPAEFERKRTWGHCTVDYALRVATAAGVRRLALFHHDPQRDDDALDEIARCAAAAGERAGVEVITAREGLRLTVAGAA
jgi:phosphoribosyl 1,2-cyclic phosphodiesterase